VGESTQILEEAAGYGKERKFIKAFPASVVGLTRRSGVPRLEG